MKYLFYISDVRITEQTFFLDITDKNCDIHLMISYEDIKEIEDRVTLEVLYMKVN